MLFGSTTHNAQSRFLTEIPSQLTQRTGDAFESFASLTHGKASDNKVSVGGSNPYSFNAQKAPTFTKPIQKSSVTYAVGDNVLHKVFGKGMIVKAQKMGNDTMLEIAFDKVGTKTLMANFCKMEKI